MADARHPVLKASHGLAPGPLAPVVRMERRQMSAAAVRACTRGLSPWIEEFGNHLAAEKARGAAAAAGSVPAVLPERGFELRSLLSPKRTECECNVPTTTTMTVGSITWRTDFPCAHETFIAHPRAEPYNIFRREGTRVTHYVIPPGHDKTLLVRFIHLVNCQAPLVNKKPVPLSSCHTLMPPKAKSERKKSPQPLLLASDSVVGSDKPVWHDMFAGARDQAMRGYMQPAGPPPPSAGAK